MISYLFLTACILQFKHWIRRDSPFYWDLVPALITALTLSVAEKLYNESYSPKKQCHWAFQGKVYLTRVWDLYMTFEIFPPDFEISSNSRILLMVNFSVNHKNIMCRQMDKSLKKKERDQSYYIPSL